jgi:hypothetical protein
MLVVCIWGKGALQLTHLCVFHTGQDRSCFNAAWSTFVFRVIRGESRPVCLVSCSVELKLQNESTQMFSYSALLITLKILTQLTPWNVASLGSKGIPAFYGSRRLIDVFKKAHHWNHMPNNFRPCSLSIASYFSFLKHRSICISQLIFLLQCFLILYGVSYFLIDTLLIWDGTSDSSVGMATRLQARRQRSRGFDSMQGTRDFASP